MAAISPPTSSFRLCADAIRDVCARPAVLLALGASVPSSAVSCAEQRRQAVTDGVARALTLAVDLAEGRGVRQEEQVLLEEAERRMWEPIDAPLSRLLQQTGRDGLFAYLAIEGATRREAWRADTQRGRRQQTVELLPDHGDEPSRESLDLTEFRLELEQVAALTAERTRLPHEIAVALVAEEMSYVEAGRRTGRSSNSLWMAIARMRPEWRGLAERGRDAGLGGGILVRLSDQTDRAVRRAVRWRLIGGVTAALLLAGAFGAITAASLLSGAPLPPRVVAEPVIEAATPTGEGAFGPTGRLLALEAVRQVWPRPTQSTEPTSARVTARTGAGSEQAATTPPPTRTTTATPVATSATTIPSCGLGSAALTCR